MNKKVALILPNSKWSSKNKSVDWTIWPLSLCSFAAILEPAYEVEILDANIDDLSLQGFAQKIRAMRPFAMGLSVFCDDFAEAGHAAARIAKELDPRMTVIMGGSYVTLNYDVAAKDANLDWLVVGEGEQVLKGILDFVVGASTLAPDKGVIRRMPDGTLSGLVCPVPITDLDKLPLPKYERIDFAKYANKEDHNSAYKPASMPYGRITTSRGCPLQCYFCQVEAINGKGIRFRSPENVLAEVELLISKYGIRSLLVDDANFTVNRNRAKEIIKGFIARDFQLQWKIMNLAVYTLDEELLELMLRSGCNHVDLTIESGVPRVLKEIIHKPINLDQVLSILTKAKRMGFQTSANFVIGFPGETWEEIRQTIRFAEQIDVDYVKIMVAMPLRRTQLHEIAQKEGFLRKNFDVFNMRWGLGEISTDEFSNIDTTILRVYEWDRINFSSEEKIARVCRLMGIDRATVAKMRAATRRSLEQTLRHGDL